MDSVKVNIDLRYVLIKELFNQGLSSWRINIFEKILNKYTDKRSKTLYIKDDGKFDFDLNIGWMVIFTGYWMSTDDNLMDVTFYFKGSRLLEIEWDIL